MWSNGVCIRGDSRSTAAHSSRASAVSCYFREYQPPFLAVWGKNDPFFLPAGAEAFKRDMSNADVRFFDTGHFALETHSCSSCPLKGRNWWTNPTREYS